MAITFQVAGTGFEQLAFAYSPLLEAVLSLGVLVEPKHHPVQHPWVRAMRRLSPGLKREMAAFGFAYRDYFPAFFFPSARGDFATFEEELGRLRALPEEEVRFEFALPLTGALEGRDFGAVAEPAVHETILAQGRALGAATGELVQLLLDDPQRFLVRFIDLLGEYWEAAFREEWVRIEGLLDESIAVAGRRLAREGLYPFLADLWPEVRVDPTTERFWLERPHEHLVVVGPEERVVLSPSYYVWPHVRVNCDPPWPLCLVFPVPGLGQEARPTLPPETLLLVLRALADETRLRALRLIAERPRSTQELAPLVGISESALSKQLQVLRAAGLVQPQREGYYVLYHFTAGSLGALTSSVEHFLQAAPADGELMS